MLPLAFLVVKRNRHKWVSSLARVRPLESVIFQKLFEPGHFVLPSTPDPHSTGLLGIPALSSRSPDRSLRRIASHTIEAVETLEQCIYSRKRWQIPAAQMMDVLSDTLCRVLDVCEFIRNGSSQAAWQEAANVAFDDLYDVMNKLNTKLELYETVKEELSDLASKGPSEGKKVLELMLRDFEQSGIHLAPHLQERFRQHSQRIQQLTHLFLNPPDVPVKSPWGRNHDDQSLGHVLLTCPDEAQRKVAYEARFNEERPEWQILQDLMREKQQLAALLGHASFSDWFLKDKMFSTPDQVGQFLTSLSTLTHEPINEAYNVLGRLKRQLSSSVDKTGELVNPWDRDYLVNQFNRRMINADFSASFIELRPYLQPGQILFALSQLYQELFEIQLEPVPVAECEIWHSDVRKLNVYQLNGSATRTLLGSIYLDLFARNGKPTGAAHYTVRCGRRIWDWEADLCPKLSGWDGIGQREKRQTALVVLGCSAKNREYFTVEEVETLFHEMGHALHCKPFFLLMYILEHKLAMVSQSDYHHVAGTRCQLDFVEIPSVLAEKFATHPTFLESSLYHPQTQDLIPKGLFNDYLVKTRHTKEAHTLRLLELHQQLLLSQVDLTFHSASSSPQQPLLELLRRVEQDPLINPTSIKREKTFPWPMSIAHLGSYGSGYYSYLVARIVSERMWREAFYSKSLAKQHGPRYLKSVLQWGGSRDGWECLSDFFQAPIKGQSLLKGDDGSGWMDEWIKNL